MVGPSQKGLLGDPLPIGRASRSGVTKSKRSRHGRSAPSCCSSPVRVAAYDIEVSELLPHEIGVPLVISAIEEAERVRRRLLERAPRICVGLGNRRVRS